MSIKFINFPLILRVYFFLAPNEMNLTILTDLSYNRCLAFPKSVLAIHGGRQQVRILNTFWI